MLLSITMMIPFFCGISPTELCYNNLQDQATNKEQRDTAKLLSDYMLYLMVMKPDILCATKFGALCGKFTATMANTRRTTRTSDQQPTPHERIVASVQETNLPPPSEPLSQEVPLISETISRS